MSRKKFLTLDPGGHELSTTCPSALSQRRGCFGSDGDDEESYTCPCCDSTRVRTLCTGQRAAKLFVWVRPLLLPFQLFMQ